MLKTEELPRLTGFLRAYSNVCAPWAKVVDFGTEDLVLKRKELNERQARLYSFDAIRDFLVRNSNLKEDALLTLLREVKLLAKDIVGSDATTKMIDAATIYLLDVLKNCDVISQKETIKLRRMFGTYSTSTLKKTLELVRKIISSLKDDVREELIKNGFPLKKDDFADAVEFGSKIKFVDQQPLDDSFYVFSFNDTGAKSGNAFEGLSFKFEQNSSEPIRNSVKVTEVTKRPVVKKYDHQWLESEIKNSMTTSSDTHISPVELVMSIVHMLKSLKSSEELQNDLFELLGFDRYELIFEILQHRDSLAAIKIESLSDVKTLQTKSNECIPSYLRKVTIQSETEVLLSKQIRKDEKRIQKSQSGATRENPSILDPKYLKFMREAQLVTAKNTPLFSQPSRASHERTRFPNVYDTFAEISTTAAFISGRKLLLPENNKRITNGMFEEISIPAVSRSDKVMEVLVPIESLDQVGKKAFAGVKNLNLIQSMVFNVAYNTQENMLVCAPTGAGKTNVAMLTVIREIKNNMEGNEIKKDKFKIVYVAPMKALASEVVKNFGGRLKSLGIQVKELTGDMQLTKREILQTQMLVTTPEKWDVVTRKATGDVALTQLVRLLILDEVHLLDGDRGPVLEALVARTLRLVESSQSMIRILGLSATLPNYIDVSRFLRVNPMIGLFFFDDRFRPVPLSTTFVGIKTLSPVQQVHDMNEVCYRKVLQLVLQGHQVMVFVHARTATVRTAMVFKEMSQNQGHTAKFTDMQNSKEFSLAQKQMMKSKNKQLRELFDFGFAIHHAGMARMDRNYVEKFFKDGFIKCLVCTSTLAWGVNLPARAVIIKGTDIYDSKHGSFVDLGVLDVMQIFGRAGRPQYDSEGEGTIITTHDKLNFYLSLLTRQHQIESNFINNLADHLNAEIGLGTVTNIDEGVAWLSYTYLYVRMMSNPHAYGLKPQLIEDDFQLMNYRRKLIQDAAEHLAKAKMVNFDVRNGYLSVTNYGRTASHFYITCETVNRFNEVLHYEYMTDKQIFCLIAKAKEFDQLKVREDELTELDILLSRSHMEVTGGSESTEGKVNILMQSYLSRANIESFSLISDQAYVVQNATRIIRFLFEVALRRGWAMRSANFLKICLMLERQLWFFDTPLHQFPDISRSALEKLDRHNWNIELLKEMPVDELGLRTRCHKEQKEIFRCLKNLPSLIIVPGVQPITDKILRISLQITPDFQWNDYVHGTGSQPFWIWIEDPDSDMIYHFEYFMIIKKQVLTGEAPTLVFTIPLLDEVKPSQYLVRVMSDRFLGSDRTFPVDFQKLILPHHHQPQTELLDLQPLPVTALHVKEYQKLYDFEYFNPIQTQIFHALYHTDNNVLLGAPTGSGKTISAEIAMFRTFNQNPKTKVVYIAPLKALVRERIEDWKVRMEKKLGMKVVELTGDVTPDAKAVASAKIIVTTPEKWDGVSRSWQTRNYVKDVSLMIIDEIHLLGEERGPVLEVIVSRTNFISAHTERKVRIIGLSTALANAQDLGNWLSVGKVGLYNFKPSVRPVPLEVHVSGYPGKHYCPRMALMNKPTYQAIRTHSPDKPSLVFVSSRRQTRLTALDLIAFLAAENNPRQWVHMPDDEVEILASHVRDQNLKLSIAFGIGLHHAGLHESDRKMVEELFRNQKIQVLIATSTLAWGVNLPAHLVVIKGTEYYDGKTHRYVDFPITDVLQMMGRAGRPQFDTEGVAVVLVQDIKKDFYKKFLYSPFPVESSLMQVLPDHINAEIVSGTITSRQQCLDYLTWTYYFRRLLQNPAYYGLECTDPVTVNKYLSGLVSRCVSILEGAQCIIEEDQEIRSTTLGQIASYYYLNHSTLFMFREHLTKDVDIDKALFILTEAHEYNELPVRHNEDSLNQQLAKDCRIEVNIYTFDSPHTKTHLLLQAHFSRLQLPCADYNTDLKSVLDQAIRIIQAMIDVSADKGWLSTTICSMMLLQMIIQGRWYDDNKLLILPHIEKRHLFLFRLDKDSIGSTTKKQKIDCLPDLINRTAKRFELLASMMKDEFGDGEINEVFRTLSLLPIMEMSCSLKGQWTAEKKLTVKQIKLQRITGVRPQSHRLVLEADREYTLIVDLKRLSKLRQDSKALAPKFPKQKDEGWFLVLGIVDTQELVAMKRIPCIHRNTTHKMVFYTPEKESQVIYTIFLLSDCYMGLDQQFDIYVDVTPKSYIAASDSEDSDASSAAESSHSSSIFLSDDEDIGDSNAA